MGQLGNSAFIDNLLTPAGQPEPDGPTLEVVEQQHTPLGRGVSCIGTPLRIGDQRFEHGLGSHSNSRLIVRSPAPLDRLIASIGLDQNERCGPGAGSVVFIVRGGGRELFRSAVRRGGPPAEAIHVPLGGSTEVELIVEDAGDGPNCDHADWAEARVVTTDGRTFNLQDLPSPRLPEESGPPFSFLIDGRSSRDVLPGWRFEPDVAGGRWTSRDGLPGWRFEPDVAGGRWTSPDGLELRWEARGLNGYNAAEWVLRLANRGTRPSPIIEGWQALDIVIRAPRPGFTLHSLNGAPSNPTDFEPRRQALDGNTSAELRAAGGRSSNGDFPFFRVDAGDRTLMVAIGWSGQWRATFDSPDHEALRLRAGLERTRFRLLPGEEVRSPRILIYEHTGDRADVFSRWRELLSEHYVARRDGQVPDPTFFLNTCFTRGGGWLNECDEANQISLIRAFRPLGLQAVLTDAGWFEGGWPNGAGNWTPRRAAYPRGLGPVAAAAAEAGMVYGLWFEPERVVAGTQVHREHPDWCLADAPGERGTYLLDFGNPAAREWFLGIVAGFMDLPGFRVYRQDFNMDPLPYWRHNDAPDRVGITEMKYIAGLYEYWDAIARRWPDSFREECASGGRRIDLETLSRMHVHQKSDYWFDSEVDQATLWTLSQYLPNQAISVPVNKLDDYSFRSALPSSLIPGWIADAPEFDTAAAARLADEYRSLRHLFVGGYYPLLDYSRSTRDWVAMQFHRRDLDEGVVLAYRRAESDVRTVELALGGLTDGAQYELTRVGEPGSETVAAAALQRDWPLTIARRREAVIVRYRRRPGV